MKHYEYEVYVDSTHGSDVYITDDFQQAVAEAYKWSQELKGESDVVIERVERDIVYRLNGGKVVYDHSKIMEVSK